MQIRFGYVAIALGVPCGSPNKTVTVKNLEKVADQTDRFNRLRRLLRENLETTMRILRYNTANQVHLYRFTSNTVPLATHPITQGWDFIAEHEDAWRQIGGFVQANKLRVSAHPDHFTLLNSPRPEVLQASLRDLDYHARVFEAMGLDISPSLVIHVGGLYKEKPASLQRFEKQFSLLPDRIKLRLMLENDDKIYTASEVLNLCEKMRCPMVLDIHHLKCNNGGEDLNALWPRIIATWRGSTPKIHVSSPKSSRDFRAHADYIALEDILPFLAIAKDFNHDFDIMVEAKQKDIAMFKLVKDLAEIKGFKQNEQAAIMI